MISALIGWSVPTGKPENRTDRELAHVFVFTHLFGPLLAQPMWAYLRYISPTLDLSVAILAMSTTLFWALPVVLLRTGNIALAGMLSFQLLAMIALIA